MMQKPEALFLDEERGEQHDQPHADGMSDEDKHTPFDDELELWILASST